MQIVYTTLYRPQPTSISLRSNRTINPGQDYAQILVTKFSQLRNIHTAGTNLAVIDTLSRDFSKTTTYTCQPFHKTPPPHIEFF